MRSDPLTPSEEQWLHRALSLIRFVRDPAFPGLLVMGGLILAGFVVIALAWNGTAGTIYVPLQLPHIVSGGLGGLALIGTGVALFYVQMSRRDAAREQRMTGDLLDEVAALMALVPRLRRLSLRK